MEHPRASNGPEIAEEPYFRDTLYLFSAVPTAQNVTSSLTESQFEINLQSLEEENNCFMRKPGKL